jgi:hypothetical protein
MGDEVGEATPAKDSGLDGPGETATHSQVIWRLRGLVGGQLSKGAG